ncbi:MAG: hypothetical protein CMP23_06910 [Rickettsiales bacterium]|nr:hypothetical protein [Rickettsiales bacterium]
MSRHWLRLSQTELTRLVPARLPRINKRTRTVKGGKDKVVAAAILHQSFTRRDKRQQREQLPAQLWDRDLSREPPDSAVDLAPLVRPALAILEALDLSSNQGQNNHQNQPNQRGRYRRRKPGPGRSRREQP